MFNIAVFWQYSRLECIIDSNSFTVIFQNEPRFQAVVRAY